MEFSIFVIVFAVLVILTLYMGVKSVPQGFEWTVERFGRFTHVLRPGLNLIIPFIDRIGAKINMREIFIDVNRQEIITRDNAIVSVDGVVFYQVLDAKKAAYEVFNLEGSIINLTVTNVRTVMGEMDLDEMLSNREKINAQLMRVVDEATNPWGIKVTRIEIKDISPPKDLSEAMARQMKAEREKRASVLEAQGEREAAILRAEGQRNADILVAEGAKQAAILNAEAREREAEAEARATKMVSVAIEEGNVNAVNYFIAQEYIGALGKMASAHNHKVIMMPLEASNMIGSIAGIAEVAKEAFNPHDLKKTTSSSPGSKKLNQSSDTIEATSSKSQRKGSMRKTTLPTSNQ